MDHNAEITAALRFHNATKYRVFHGPTGETEYVMGTAPELEPAIWEEDWSIEPRPYKVYASLPPIALPSAVLHTDAPALSTLANLPAVGTSLEGGPDRAALAHIARLSNGLLNRSLVTSNRRRLIEFRTAGGTGARYHLELYFVCGDLPDLPAGVYHYATQDHSLRQLRSGDLRGVLVSATGSEPSLLRAPAALVMTSTFWRNAWRYRARAYRHTFWDAGTSLTHVLAVAASLGLPAHLVMGFADQSVNALLGVDGEREAAVAICALGSSVDAPPAPAQLTPIDHPTQPVSEREVVFEEIPRMHTASRLQSGEAAAAWRATPLRRAVPRPEGPVVPLAPLAPDALPGAPIEEVILGRRSRRKYDLDQPISFEQFSTVLACSSRGIAADCLAEGAPPLHDNYVIVHAVAGLKAGVYLHRVGERAVELVRPGLFRAQAAHLAFDQSYAGEAHVNSYYLTQLGPVLEAYGNRGYRLAQLEAAIYAGRVHLAAEALGLGAVGSTSFDDEVTEFFSPRAAGASFMFVTVFGKRRPRAPGQS